MFGAKVYLMTDQETVQVFQTRKDLDSKHYRPDIRFKTASLEDPHEVGRLLCAALKGHLHDS